MASTDGITSGKGVSNHLSIPMMKTDENTPLITHLDSDQHVFVLDLISQTKIGNIVNDPLIMVIEIGITLHNSFQIPLDVEFVIDLDGKVKIVQVRPIIYPIFH